MGRKTRTNRHGRSDPGTTGVRSVRCGVVGLSFALLLCFAVQATELANPMEKHFSSATEDMVVPSGQSRNFSDHTLPSSPPSNSTLKKKPGQNIRQVSGAAAPVSAWDAVATSVDKETTLADWGVKPSTAVTQSPPSPMVPGHSYAHNPTGTNEVGNAGQWQQANPYFNTGPAYATSPGQPNPWMNPYGQAAAPNIAPGMMGMTPNANGYYSPDFASPWSAYGSGAYGMTPSPYDPSGMAGMYDPSQQRLALYQAMLQQEMIRREVEQEIEEEERATKEAEAEAKAKADADASWSVKQLMPVHVTSPLGSTLLACAKTITPFSTPTGPHRGVGQPLVGGSWLDRPWYFGGFCGWISGSELVKDMIDQKEGAMGGLILGYNISEYWGVESRLHFASIDIKETTNGRQAFVDRYTSLYPDSTYVPNLTTRTNQLSVFDVSVHYYPLGNAKWRPYFKYGLGVARESFVDTFGTKRREDTMTMPIGIGLRYWWNKNLAIQADLIDNVVFSSGIARTQNNVAFCVGLTYSYGSSKKTRPTTYWPYTPSHGSKR